MDNLSKFDYPKNSKINFVNVTNTFVYGDSPLDSKSYSLSTSNIEINSYSDGIELATTEDTLASFTVIIKDGNFIGFIDAELLPIYADSTNAFSINDLASNFFSDKATIYTYSSISVCSYEKDNYCLPHNVQCALWGFSYYYTLIHIINICISHIF